MSWVPPVLSFVSIISLVKALLFFLLEFWNCFLPSFQTLKTLCITTRLSIFKHRSDHHSYSSPFISLPCTAHMNFKLSSIAYETLHDLILPFVFSFQTQLSHHRYPVLQNLWLITVIHVHPRSVFTLRHLFLPRLLG